MSPNIPASIKARLLAKAKEREEEFELFLVRYACERFLYRLGASALRNRLTLKGAGLLTVWMDDPYRSTRDLDFLASGASDQASIRTVVETICSVSCQEDGMIFDTLSLCVSPGSRGRGEVRGYGQPRPSQQPYEGLSRRLGPGRVVPVRW